MGLNLRAFKTRSFARFASRESIDDVDRCVAVRRMARGLVDADLGGGVIKQRIARKGQGMSGGYRGIVLLRRNDRSVFAYGFAKSVRHNLRRDELKAFRLLADELLALARIIHEGAASGWSRSATAVSDRFSARSKA